MPFMISTAAADNIRAVAAAGRDPTRPIRIPACSRAPTRAARAGEPGHAPASGSGILARNSGSIECTRGLGIQRRGWRRITALRAGGGVLATARHRERQRQQMRRESH